MKATGFIREAKVIKQNGDFCTIQFATGGGIRIRTNRIYASREEAENMIVESKKKIGYCSPYEFFY